MPLWMRLALGMSLLAIVPVTAVGLSALGAATRNAAETTQTRLREEALVQADVVGRWVRDQARLVLAMPQAYGDRLSQLTPEAQAAFPRLVYRLVPSAVTVVLVDGDGLVVADPVFVTTPGDRTPGSIERARQLVDRLPLSDVLARPDVAHMGDAWMPGGLGSRPSFPLAVLASGGASSDEVRVLGVEVALEIGDDLLHDSDSRHAIAVLDRSGFPLVGTSPLIEADRLRPLLGTEHPVDFALEGTNVLGAIAPVPNTPGWSLVVAEVVRPPTAEIRGRVVPWLVGATAAALWLAVVAAGWVSRPVEKLRDAALLVAEGKLGTKAEIDRTDEIGELARAFDHMSERLEANRREIEAQQREIEAFNRELQQRVEERTRELRLAQEELVRAGQLAAVAELGAGLAHELNNPLAAVLGLAQILRARHPGDPLLADLEREADRCREVVSTLRRVQTGEVDPAESPVVQLRDVLGQVRDLVGGSFRQRGVQLELEDASEALRVRLDPVQGSRLLAQILNALRAGLDPGAVVRVRALDEGPAVVVEIASDRPIAAERDRRDDWMASGHSLWVARQLLARLGGRLEEGARVWRVVLARATDARTRGPAEV